MKHLVLLVFLSTVAAGFTGHFSIVTVVLAFVILWEAPRFWRGVLSGRIGSRQLLNVLYFLLDFAWDLAKSNVILAWDVLTPKDYHDVVLIEVPIADLNPREITFLSHRITLTPGTLSCIVSADHKILLVHAMYSGGENRGLALRRPIDILKGNLNG